MNPRNWPTCPNGGKRCYPSRRMAKLGMANAHNKIRPYFCKHCRSWHVTAQERVVRDSARSARSRPWVGGDAS